jgi:hypothetical protein
MIFKIRIDAPRGGLPRLLWFVGLPLALVMAAAMFARAFDTSWIQVGQPVSAASLKGDLDEAQNRLATLESRVTSLESVNQSYYLRMKVLASGPVPSPGPVGHFDLETLSPHRGYLGFLSVIAGDTLSAPSYSSIHHYLVTGLPNDAVAVPVNTPQLQELGTGLDGAFDHISRVDVVLQRNTTTGGVDVIANQASSGGPMDYRVVATQLN